MENKYWEKIYVTDKGKYSAEAALYMVLHGSVCVEACCVAELREFKVIGESKVFRLDNSFSFSLTAYLDEVIIGRHFSECLSSGQRASFVYSSK